MSFRSDASMPDRIDEAPDPNAGYGLKYRCLECRWTGVGGALAFDHHRQTHHRIALTVTGDRVFFFCCPDILCATCETRPRVCPECNESLCDCAREEHVCPAVLCGGCDEPADRCRCDDPDERDDDYERAAAHARQNDFEDTGGKDWT
jgi:hypothetical protein